MTLSLTSFIKEQILQREAWSIRTLLQTSCLLEQKRLQRLVHGPAGLVDIMVGVEAYPVTPALYRKLLITAGMCATHASGSRTLKLCTA